MAAPRRTSPFVLPELFPIDGSDRRPRALPTIGEQKDIRYHAANARGLLNGPESTGMDYWSVNPYVGCAFGCTYCYARYAHRYALQRALSAASPSDALRAEIESVPPWLAFERHVLVKENAAELLTHELRPGGARLAALEAGQVVVIGTATDPYQPAERRFGITRSVLETLATHSRLSIVVITKSPLITRDVEVLRRITEPVRADDSSLTHHHAARPGAADRAARSNARCAHSGHRPSSRVGNRCRHQRDAGASGHHRQPGRSR